MSDEVIRLAGIVRESIVDGPGIRFTVFGQGCPHGCVGCHNPETHDPKGGTDCSIERIVDEIRKNPLLRGVTFSGGEPFFQAEAFSVLAEKIKESSAMDIVVFTGYTVDELLKSDDPQVRRLLEYTDILVDGPYVESERNLALRFRGSSNQRIIDMKKTLDTGKTVLMEEYM